MKLIINKHINRCEYFDKHGHHFNEKLCNFAISHMRSHGKQLTPWSKDLIDLLLRDNGIILKSCGWDYVYIANMVKSDFYLSSIEDITHVAKYIKDVIEDEDGPDGFILHRWISDMKLAEINIDWESMI